MPVYFVEIHRRKGGIKEWYTPEIFDKMVGQIRAMQFFEMNVMREPLPGLTTPANLHFDNKSKKTLAEWYTESKFTIWPFIFL